MRTESTEVAVVGAGIIGCIVARDLAADHDVLVLDRSGVAAGATGYSAGLVAPTLFYGDLPAVARRANAFVREFDGTGEFAFTERRRLDLVEPDATDDARERAAELADRGFPVAFLPAAAAERRYPAFDLSGFAGAVEYGDTGWVDPYTYAVELKNDAERRGAVVERADVRGFRVEDGGIAGVETDRGERRADRVVVAAGWRTPALLADLVELPVRPYRTQCVVLDPGIDVGDGFPLVRASSEGLYLRPEHGGGLLVGGGAHLTDAPGKESRQADEPFRQRVAATVPRLLPGAGDARFVDGWAGIDAATPDGRPIVDTPVDAPDGLVVATGFNGLGVMVSPAAAAAVRALLGGGDAPFPVEPFALARFDSRSREFDLYSTSAM